MGSLDLAIETCQIESQGSSSTPSIHTHKCVFYFRFDIEMMNIFDRGLATRDVWNYTKDDIIPVNHSLKGVQRRQILVVNVCVCLILCCFLVAVSDLVHDEKAIFYLPYSHQHL